MFSFGSNLSVTDRQTTDKRQTDRRTMKNLSPLHHRPQRGNNRVAEYVLAVGNNYTANGNIRVLDLENESG